MLAVHGIWIMARQTAIRAGILHFAWAKNGLNQPQKQRDANQHNRDRQHLPGGAGQGNIAKTGRGQGGDSEIECVDVGGDLRVGAHLNNVNEGGHHKNEYEQIEHGLDDLFMLFEKFVVLPQITQNMIGAQQPQGPQDTQKQETLNECWRDQSYNDHQIRPVCKARKEPFSILRNEKPGHKIKSNEKRDNKVGGVDPWLRARH